MLSFQNHKRGSTHDSILSLKPNHRGVHLVVSEIKGNPFVDDTTYYRP